MRATAMVRTKSSGSSLARTAERRAFHLHQHVDRHAFRMHRQAGQRRDHADAVVEPLAHADDAAAADMDAGVAHVVERVEPVLIGARGDDGAVIFRRGVEVVVVVVEAGRLSAAPPARRSACRAWRRSPAPSALTPSTMAQTWSRSRSLGARQAAPMQKREAPEALAARASASTASIAISFSALTPVSYCAALRAIGAVLRTAAGLDRQQRRDLHLGRIEILPVHCAGAEHQLRKRQREQRAHLLARPVVAGRNRSRCGAVHREQVTCVTSIAPESSRQARARIVTTRRRNL